MEYTPLSIPKTMAPSTIITASIANIIHGIDNFSFFLFIKTDIISTPPELAPVLSINPSPAPINIPPSKVEMTISSSINSQVGSSPTINEYINVTIKVHKTKFFPPCFNAIIKSGIFSNKFDNHKGTSKQCSPIIAKPKKPPVTSSAGSYIFFTEKAIKKLPIIQQTQIYVFFTKYPFFCLLSCIIWLFPVKYTYKI